MARYIPLSANRRLIIINHYPVYRLCVCARMRLSLSLFATQVLGGRLFARTLPILGKGRGERTYFYVRSRDLQVLRRGIIAVTPQSGFTYSLPLWSFREARSILPDFFSPSIRLLFFHPFLNPFLAFSPLPLSVYLDRFP